MAQNNSSSLKWSESVAYLPINHDGAWHLVQGTQVTITLSSTPPASTDSKRYEQEVTYRKGTEALTGNTDTFEPTSGEVLYTAVFKYKDYAYDETTESWTTDDVVHEETASAGEFQFKVYSIPSVSDIIMKTNPASTYYGGKSISVGAEYTTSPEELNHTISWFLNGKEVKNGEDTYNFTPESAGKADIEAKVSVMAPDGSTAWTSKASKTNVTVYEKPEISDFKVTSDLPYTYVGGSDRKITASYKTSPEALPVIIEWFANGKKVENEGNTYTLSPTESGDAVIQAKVSIMDPDGNDTWETATQSTNIKVYEKPQIADFKVTPDQPYTYVGGSDRKITASYKTSPEALPVIIEWFANGKKVENEGNTYTLSPTESGDAVIQAKVSIMDPDGNDTWETATQSTSIKVYEKPQIADFKVAPDLPYTYVGGSDRKITASYKTSPEALPVTIEWFANGKKVENEGNTYTLSPTEPGDAVIQAKVSIMDPDGNDTWETATQSTSIKVYEKPQIADFKVTTDFPYAYIGENDKQVTASYKTSPEMLPVKIEWNVNGTNTEGSSNTFHFIPSAVGNAEITAKVSILAPDGITIWETADERMTIQVVDAPQYAEIDMHQQPVDSHEYAIYTGETFDIEALYTHSGGYPEGWLHDVAINGKGETNMQFTPSESGDYNISLIVENLAPGASMPWLRETSNYTLHVYDVPTWSTNLDKIFADESHVLNAQSGDDITFEVLTQHGSTSGWSVEIEDKQDGTVTLQNENGTFRHTFQWANSSEAEATKNLTLRISNSIDFQTKGSKDYAEAVDCKIIIWKDITATISLPESDTEGKCLIKTREGDEQKFKVSLAGGNAAKWSITTTCDENANGTYTLDKYAYTYTLAPGTLTSNGAESKQYTYDVTAIYNDGQTHVEKKLPVDIQVWPAPQVEEGLVLTNKSEVQYISKHTDKSHTAYENIKYYDSDSLTLLFSKQGGVPGGDWKYQINDGVKQDVPDDGAIRAEGTKSVTFYNYIASEAERRVLTVNISSTVLPSPEVATNRFPTVDMTTASDWENAEIEEGKNTVPVDLYGDGSHTVQFDFSPIEGKYGNENGWTYRWSINDELASTDANKWRYTATMASASAYEDKILSVEICNKITKSSAQSGENIGLSMTKRYKVRVWHKAVLPDAVTFLDVENPGNDMNSTLSIRDGNTMQVHVTPIQYGYAPDADAHYQYVWTGTEQTTNVTNWSTQVAVTNDQGRLTYESSAIGLTVKNVGPRGTVWEERHVGDYDIRVFNKPRTPNSLVKKGNGNSGTMIVSTHISDEELQANDYYLVFGYTTSDGDVKFEAKKQVNDGETRWTRQYNNNEEMSTAFVYSAWIDKESHVLVTSGRCYLGDETDEKWDDSDYTYSSIANKTRAAISTSATAIQTPQTETGERNDMRVYDTNGILIGTGTEGLPSGLYIIRYKEGGVEKCEKVSIN